MNRIMLVFLTIALGFATGALAEPVIILNQAVASENIDPETVQKIYLGKKSKWGNGDKIVMAALNDGPVHEGFLTGYIKKSPAQFDSFWKKMFFTGSGVPPKAFASESEVVEFVSATKGAIGYIDSATPNSNVTVVNIK